MSTSPLSVHDDPRIARQLVLGVFTTEDDGLGIVDCADGDGARSDSRPPTKNHPELLAWFQRQIGSRLARLFVNRHGCAAGVYRSDLNAWIAKAGTQHTASSKHDCEKPVERAPPHAIAAVMMQVTSEKQKGRSNPTGPP